MTEQWRCLDSGPGSAAWNMALDLSLLHSSRPEPCIRFYQWSPPALSIGRFQDPQRDLQMEEIHRLSLPWVRRITGGGAIWHYHELTYSLVCTLEDLGTHSVKQSFKILCDFLLQTYRTLGLEADFALHQAEQPSGLGKKTPVCFAGQEYYDILVNGRKLGGNAQRREGHKIFQHGSIPLELDRDSFALLFREKDLPVPDSITSLSEEGIALPLPGLTRLMKDHFVASLGITLKEEVPSPQELELARRYEKDRFCSNDWNLRAALS